MSLVAVVVISNTTLAQSFSFDDIQFWVGSGMNRAALLIDWVEASADQPALAWGYRWDGTASGADMLQAIVAADPRLVAKLGGTQSNPNAVYGLGYDWDDDNHDEDFPLNNMPIPPEPLLITTPFDQDGFFYTNPADGDGADDHGDYYAEGWFTGFWHYGVAATNPYVGGSWSDTAEGVAARTLADGVWDSWTFSRTFDFTSFAENPSAAASPFSPGDFNRDGRVDAADYSLWRSNFGSSLDLAADGNGNGIVDTADYVVWRRHVEEPIAVASGVVAPEPCSTGLAMWSLFALLHVRFTYRKVKI